MEHSLVGAIVVDDADTLAVVLSVVNLLSLGVAAESLRIEQLWNYRFLAGAVNVDDRQRPFGVTRLLICYQLLGYNFTTRWHAPSSVKKTFWTSESTQRPV